MSISSYRVWIMALSAIIISLAAIVMSTYSMTKGIQAAPALAAAQRYPNDNFIWNLGEVVEVQGNLYAYLGYEKIRGAYDEDYNLRLATWQNAWMELTYSLGSYSYSQGFNVTLSPYKLQVYRFSNSYLNATFRLS